MNGRTRALILLVAVVLLAAVSCKRENRETVTTDTGVAPTQAGATDTSYVGGGGNVTTSTGPTSTDTAGTSGGTAMTSSAGTADVGGGSKKADAAMKKATTEPGKAGSSPGKKH
jgi:hypothetical protein